MPTPDSRHEYTARMHRVLEHVDRHLDQPLNLDALATVAHFSPFHFHRLFTAWMGETLGDYLRRRRLEIAAVRLIAQPRTPVLHIALAVGFGSAEAFARAFKERFGCSATEWRAQQRPANSKLDQAKRKINQALHPHLDEHVVSAHSQTETLMNVKLVERQPTAIAYLRYAGPYGAPVEQFWQHTVYPWMVANDLLDQPRYGLSHDDPNITAAEKCRYDACVEVHARRALSGNALRTTLAGGRYASLPFKGTVASIGDAWTALLRDWLPASGLQLDARPAFEYYPRGASFDPATGVFDCEICIPVAPL